MATENPFLPTNFKYATTGLYYLCWSCIGAALVARNARVKDTLILVCVGMGAPLAVVGSAVQTGSPLLLHNLVRHYLPLGVSSLLAARNYTGRGSKLAAATVLVTSATSYAVLIAPAAAGPEGVGNIYADDSLTTKGAQEERFYAIVVTGIIVSVLSVYCVR